MPSEFHGLVEASSEEGHAVVLLEAGSLSPEVVCHGLGITVAPAASRTQTSSREVALCVRD